jgi:hypothetical protein
MSLDEAIRQEIKQNDATVVSGRDNLDHKCHAAKKEEETNEEKKFRGGGKKKKKTEKNEKPRHTSPELNVGMRATKLQKSTEKTTRQQVGSATNSHTHTNSLSPLSLSLFTARVSPEGERRQRQALSVPEWLRERHITDSNVRDQTPNKPA